MTEGWSMTKHAFWFPYVRNYVLSKIKRNPYIFLHLAWVWFYVIFRSIYSRNVSSFLHILSPFNVAMPSSNEHSQRIFIRYREMNISFAHLNKGPLWNILNAVLCNREIISSLLITQERRSPLVDKNCTNRKSNHRAILNVFDKS